MHRNGLILTLPTAALALTLGGCPIFWEDGNGRRGGTNCPAEGCVEGTECRVNGDCEAGLFCDENTGTCSQVDSPNVPRTCDGDDNCQDENFFCDTRGTCVPKPEGFCRNNGECPDGQACVENVCRDEDAVCGRDVACGDRLCVDQRCTLSCNDDGDCRAGESCAEDGYCQVDRGQCQVSENCADTENCVDGQCLEDCSGGDECDDGTFCAEDGFCRPDWRPFCPANACDEDNFSVCYRGECLKTCDSDEFDTCTAEGANRDPNLNFCAPNNFCYESESIFQGIECFGPEDCDMSGARCVNAVCM